MKYAENTDEQDKIFHLVDDNGKLYCSRYRPDTLRVLKKADTFGLKLCENCKKRQSEREQVQSILSDTE